MRVGRHFVKGVKVIAKTVENAASHPISSVAEGLEYVLGVRKEINDDKLKESLRQDFLEFKRRVDNVEIHRSALQSDIQLLSLLMKDNQQATLDNLQDVKSRLLNIENKVEAYSSLDERVVELFSGLTSKIQGLESKVDEVYDVQKNNQVLVTPPVFPKEFKELLRNPRYRIKPVPLTPDIILDPEKINIVGYKQGVLHVYSIPLGQLVAMLDLVGPPSDERNVAVPFDSLRSDLIIGSNRKEQDLPRNVFVSRKKYLPDHVKTIEIDSVRYIKDETQIDGHILVRKGARLVIEPGSRIIFNNGGISNKGLLFAEGNQDSRIVFKGTAEHRGPPLLNVGTAMFDYCMFSGIRAERDLGQYKSYVIHSVLGKLSISNSIFTNLYANRGTIVGRKCDVELDSCIFRDCESPGCPVGTFHNCYLRMHDSLFRQNQTKYGLIECINAELDIKDLRFANNECSALTIFAFEREKPYRAINLDSIKAYDNKNLFGLFTFVNAQCTYKDSDFRRNSFRQNTPGGFMMVGDSPVLLRDCTVKDVRSKCLFLSDADLTFRDTRFYDNDCPALAILHPDARIRHSGCTYAKTPSNVERNMTVLDDYFSLDNF